MRDIIRIELDDREAQAKLSRLLAAGQDMTRLMANLAGLLHDSTEEAFQQKRDPKTGAAWDDLKASTKKQRTRGGTWPGNILQLTGEMAASVLASHGQDFAQVGSGLERAVFHQLGAPGASIPARPFLGLSQDDEVEITDLVNRYLAAA